MVDKFTAPRTVEEFKKMADPVQVPAAQSVIAALTLKLKKVSEPLQQEITYFEQAIEYKKTGKVPEGLE